MTSSSIPIDRLRLKSEKCVSGGECSLPTKGALCAKKKKQWMIWNKGIGEYLLWFVILTLFWFFIFYFWLPTYFQKTTGGVPNGEADTVKILIAAILISLVLVILLVWLKFI